MDSTIGVILNNARAMQPSVLFMRIDKINEFGSLRLSRFLLQGKHASN